MPSIVAICRGSAGRSSCASSHLLAAQFNLKPGEILVGAARCVATQTHGVLCLCNGSREGPSIKPAQRQPVCRSCVCVFIFAVICRPMGKYVLYLYFFLLRQKAAARRDWVSSCCPRLRNNGTTAHQRAAASHSC